jgi:hypothetical protein
MQLNLNPDVACWIDANRGELSRQKFILTLVRKMMLQDTQSTKDNNGKNNLPNGAFYAPEQE